MIPAGRLSRASIFANHGLSFCDLFEAKHQQVVASSCDPLLCKKVGLSRRSQLEDRHDAEPVPGPDVDAHDDAAASMQMAGHILGGPTALPFVRPTTLPLQPISGHYRYEACFRVSCSASICAGRIGPTWIMASGGLSGGTEQG